MKPENFFTKKRKLVKSYLKQRWGSLKETRQKYIIDSLSTILNYLFNAVFLAIPIVFITSFFYVITWQNYLKLVVILTILLPYIEHYYIWFREEWRDNLIK